MSESPTASELARAQKQVEQQAANDADITMQEEEPPELEEGSDAWKAQKWDAYEAAARNKSTDKAAASIAALNIGATGPSSFTDLIRLWNRPDKWDSSSKMPVQQYLEKEREWMVNVKLPKEIWGRLAVNNLKPAAEKEFTDAWAKPIEALAWNDFARTMLGVYSKPDASKLGRRALFNCTQKGRPVSEYSKEWKSLLAVIPSEEQPNLFDQLFHFHEGLDKWIQKLTSVDFSTGKPYEDMAALVTAANHIGSTGHESSNKGNSGKAVPEPTSSKPHKKRGNSDTSTVARPAKRANTSGEAKTPKRSEAETNWLKTKGLCFHCCNNKDKDHNPFPHRVTDCPFKKSGAAAKPMPQDFA